MNIQDEFSLILNQKGRPPKYFKLNRRKTKTLLVLLPFSIIVLFFSIGLIIFYFSTLKMKFALEKPELIKKHELEKSNLEKNISALEVKNKRLSQDLIFNDGLAFSGSQFIRVLPTSKDKTSEQLIEVDSKKVSLAPDGYKVSFNITNQSVVDRVSGHFFSILKSRNTLQFFPKTINTFNSISFKNGEYFSTSRFRPVEIKFDKLNFGSKVELIVLIYSRDGDLLHSSTQEIGISNE